MDRFRGSLTLLLGFLIVGSSYCESKAKEWWETALVYQIWPRGFQDSDGNGEGDLKGIISRLDYLKDLGIDTIWLNPIYSSPLIDSGYDISDYTNINPLFGNLQEFDKLIQEAHNRDLKVILDIVPNHSSDRHEWFKKSSEGIKPYSDYYIWADGSKDIPPNNWISTYSEEEGSAWTWNDKRKQWYYHKFHKSQPDLNLRNENVLQELMDVFDFWLTKKVDGFRINAVSYLYEDEMLRDEPVAGNGNYTSGLPENTALVYKFRSHIDSWVAKMKANSKLLIAESYDSDEVLVSLYGNGIQNGIPPFNFRFITSVKNTSTAENVKDILQNWIQMLPDSASTNWVLSNHDNSRAASRIGLNRVDGLHMLSLLLPGQAYTYYGDEIAMLDRHIPWEKTIDPMGTERDNVTYAKYSRDPARTPMQWSSTQSAGFSTSDTTYLPVHPEYVERNVEAQVNATKSNLNTYKLLAALRKNQVFTHGDYEFGTLNDDRVLVFRRFLECYPSYIGVINFGLRKEVINLTSLYPSMKDSVEVVVASSNAVNVESPISASKLVLTANAALILNTTELYNCETTPIETTTEKNSAAAFTSISQLITSSSILLLLLYKFSESL